MLLQEKVSAASDIWRVGIIFIEVKKEENAQLLTKGICFFTAKQLTRLY